MLLNVVRAIHHASKSLCKVLLEKIIDEYTSIHRNLCWEFEVAHRYPPINFVRILIIKRRIASQHFEYEDAKSPPINSMIMSCTHDDLRGKILWCTTQCECPISNSNLLSKAKVCDLEMAISCNQKVLRLEVPVSYSLMVKIFQG